MSIFDRFKTKKEKELGKADAPQAEKKVEKVEKVVKGEKVSKPAKKEAKSEVKTSGVTSAPSQRALVGILAITERSFTSIRPSLFESDG